MELDAASQQRRGPCPRRCGTRRSTPPRRCKKRVYIIDEVHMLSIAAFNALLKILEEPPEHLMFILATTELHKVPADHSLPLPALCVPPHSAARDRADG